MQIIEDRLEEREVRNFSSLEHKTSNFETTRKNIDESLIGILHHYLHSGLRMAGEASKSEGWVIE